MANTLGKRMLALLLENGQESREDRWARHEIEAWVQGAVDTLTNSRMQPHVDEIAFGFIDATSITTLSDRDRQKITALAERLAIPLTPSHLEVRRWKRLNGNPDSGDLTISRLVLRNLLES